MTKRATKLQHGITAESHLLHYTGAADWVRRNKESLGLYEEAQ